MDYTTFSNLEDMRRRRHGAASTLKLLKKVEGGLQEIATLDSRFYIGRLFSTQLGAYVTILTLDRPTALTADAARDLLFVDLAQPNLSTMRYRVSTETRPSGLDQRWVLQLTAAFNDTTEIVPVEP